MLVPSVGAFWRTSECGKRPTRQLEARKLLQFIFGCHENWCIGFNVLHLLDDLVEGWQVLFGRQQRQRLHAAVERAVEDGVRLLKADALDGQRAEAGAGDFKAGAAEGEMLQGELLSIQSRGTSRAAPMTSAWSPSSLGRNCAGYF